ncbi:hypothetical protein FACS1894123_03150 [Bacteroidia bacterium]|nr:hypothetical protein FACS1894123_03150 [Bacteroidia bacterium]
MFEIFMLYLSIPDRINFLQLGRYSRSGEQRFRRQFESGFEFFSFNRALVSPYIGKRNAVAFDASFIHKFGKHTPCTGYFWSDCPGKILRGLNALSLPDWYAAVIKKDLAQITAFPSHLVADAYFSKKGFVDKIMDMNLHLVCKLRDDADLLYLTVNIAKIIQLKDETKRELPFSMR